MTIANPNLLAFFLAIALGLLLGKVTLRGFALGDAGVLLVALVFGAAGFTASPLLRDVGLVFFLFAVGQQAGPSFMPSLRGDGRRVIAMAMSIPITAFGLTMAIKYLLAMPEDLAAGLYAGAMTSTPGLAAAVEASGSQASAISYGLSYPLGSVIVVILLKLLPKLFGADLEAEEKARIAAARAEHPALEARDYQVTNPKLDGLSLSDISIQSMTNTVLSRLQRDKDVLVPEHDTVLQGGDLLRAVGTEEALDKLELLVGDRIPKAGVRPTPNVVSRLLVLTNRSLVGKPLSQTDLRARFDANVTRVRRGGVELTPTGILKLQWGDRLRVVGRASQMDEISALIGNDLKKFHGLDVVPVALTIALGALIGSIVFFTLGGIGFRLGLTGGVLAAALVLSSVGKTGPILWQVHGRNLSILKEIGILFFLVAVGMNSGATMVETLAGQGPTLFLATIPIVLACFLPPLLLRKPLGLSWLQTLGAVAGGMTSTPGLGAVNTTTSSNAPGIAYAMVYPFSLVLNIVLAMLLVNL